MKLDESIQAVSELRSKGYTLQRIGNELGLSRQRIHQIANEFKRRAQSANHWQDGLSVRNRSLVDKLKLNSKEEVSKEIQSRNIKPFQTKNFGTRSYHDLCAWANTTPISYGRNDCCPHCGKEI